MIIHLRCLAARAWAIVSRRVGRRGALLISSGYLALIYGLSLYYPAVNATSAYLASLLPLTWWAALWIFTAGVCFVGAGMRRDRVAYGWAACAMLTWAMLMAMAWLFGTVPRGWVLATLFFALSTPLLVGAGWAEMLKLRPTRISKDFADAVVTADSRGLITGWDGTAEQMFGWSAEDVVGQELTMLMPERYRQLHADGLAHVARTGRSELAGQTIETTALTAAGVEIPVRVFIGVHSSPDGGVTFSTVVRDLRRAP